jgi:transposase
VQALQRVLFGRSSERLSKEDLRQLVFLYGATPEEAAVEDPLLVAREPADVEPEEQERSGGSKRKRRPAQRMTVADSVERVVTETSVPAAERACTSCGQEMTAIEPREHRWLDYVPAKILERIERREVLVCKTPGCRCDATTAERAEVRVVEPRVSPSLLAQLVESKCDDALPIHRQCDQFARLGVQFPVNTLYGHWAYVTDLLEPVADAVFGAVLDDEVYVAMDDTGLDVLDPSLESGKFRGHLWCFCGTTPLVAYRFTRSWKATEIEPWLHGIRETTAIQVDDYAGYSKLYPDARGGKLPLVPRGRRLGCMMHVRRRFHEAMKLGDKRAGFAVEQIRRLYEIEESVRDKPPDERLAARQTKSVPVLDVFDAWVDETRAKLGNTGHLAEALGYAHDQREFIRRCFSDGRFEIDNGRVERAIREPALGRKNFLFTGSLAAGERLAAAYTIVQSCRALGLSTRDYLIDVITKIAGGWPARRLVELMPQNWAAARDGQTPPG